MSAIPTAIIGLAAGLLVGLPFRAFVAAATVRFAAVSMAALSGTLLVTFAGAALLLSLPPATWLWLAGGALLGVALGELALRLGLTGHVQASHMLPPWQLIAGAMVVALVAGFSPSWAFNPGPPPTPTPTRSAPQPPTPRPSPSPTPTQPPSVTSVLPNCGPSAGGTQVAVGGSNLGGATAVSFGGVNGTIAAVAPTHVTVTTPQWQGKPGQVDVTVRTPAGISAPTAADRYTFTSVTITKLAPVAGSQGSTVRIEGAGFDPKYFDNVVFFGKATAPVRDGTTSLLTVVAPPGSGTVDVTVTNAGGTSCVTPVSRWTYVQPA